MNSSLHVRLMTEADLAFADSLRAVVGWNQTLQDWRRLLAYEPQGCFVAEWNGSPIGTATTTRYGAEVAWIGMLLVHPDHRGHGVGRALLEHCFQHLDGTACIKLDATPLGKKLYDKLGFQDEWPLTRWESKGLNPSQDHSSNAHDYQPVAPLVLKPWDALSATQTERFDAQVFGVPRSRMLDALAADSSETLVALSADGDALGYGLMRRGSRALYLGPAAAHSSRAGLALIKALLVRSKGQPLYWDIPDANIAAASLVKELGFIPQRQLVRMFLGRNKHPCDPSNYYALADPAIG